MSKRIRILLVCLVLLILAALLRIRLSYEDTSDHHGRGPPSVLINSDNKQLAAEKRHKLMQVPQLHMSLNNDSIGLQKYSVDSMKKAKAVLQKPPSPGKPPSPPPLPAHFTNLTNKQIQSVEKFVFFVGYGRSGHSIVASLMDAHPNMIIADEFYLFDKLSGHKKFKKLDLFNELYLNSYTCAKSGRRNASSHHTKNYHLSVDGMWQGRFSQLKVIGDKTAGSTAMMYHDHKEKFKTLYKLLATTAGVPLHTIHVIRNPYDMAATVALYQASGQPDLYRVAASVEKKFNRPSQLGRAVDIVLRKADAVSRMKSDSRLGLRLLELHSEDLIAHPMQQILSICKFLQVDCSDEYLKACKTKVFPSTSKSRELVFWTNELRNRIQTAIKKYDFFNRYSFEGS